ncbi:MAG: LysR family transcriptional regulator [Myxococcales bacterium]|nr:LysR family transcriptional regulator [Myxococcales bacterium]
MNWDDLRVLLAVAREGSLVKAAKALSTTHTTVSRRLQALEVQTGARVIDKRPDGVALTPAGAELAAAAETMEAAALAAGKRVLGQDAALSGRLRIATLDAVAVGFAPIFAAFSRRHPDVCLDVSVNNIPVSLTRREADVAIRVTDAPPEHLVGRKLGRLEYAIYASRSLVDGRAQDLLRYPWLKPQVQLRARRTEAWLAEHVPGVKIAGEYESLLSIIAAAESGQGACMLPCWLADPNPALTRLTEVLPDMGIDLWILTHPDVKQTARVRAFSDHVVAEVRPLQAILSGAGPRYGAI